MRIAVVGCGAMGSVYAGLLASAGNEVVAVDTWSEHVEAIRERGLRVEGASGDRTVRLDATSDLSGVGPCDLVVIATKAMQVEGAARSASVLAGPEALVLTIQNGLGSADRVARIVGEDRVAVGVAGGFGASVVTPGHVRHEGWELVRMGELRGAASERLERAAEAWRRAGFRVETCDDIDRVVWEKLLVNACFSGTCLLLECTIGEVLASPAAWHVASTCAVEALAVALARGVGLEIRDPAAHARAFGERIPAARPSALLDYLAGRPSEIGVINGGVSRAGREVGVAAPVNEAVATLAEAKEKRMLAGAG